MGILVSIVVPAYNVEQYLEECIESIMGQTYPDWELFIVNDGSTDRTKDVAEQYATRDRRISVITQSNGGVSAARNTGLQAATGEYVIFLDGDDFWRPALLEKLVDVVTLSGTDIAYCGYNRIYQNGFIRKYRYQYPCGDILIPPPGEPVQLHIGAMLFNKGFLNRHHLSFTVGSSIGEDWELICKAIALAKVQSVPENLMMYRQRSGSALHAGWDWHKQIHALRSFKRAISFIEEQRDKISDSEEKLVKLKQRLAYKAVRFLWRMIKWGYRPDAAEQMRSDEFAGYLKCLDIESLGLVDRLKYRVILSKNQRFWFIAKL